MDAKKIDLRNLKSAKLLSFLHVRNDVGGLEISDQALRLTYIEKESWHFVAVALPPGAMERGIVKDAAALSKALAELRAKIPSLKSRAKKMNVVVSLGSASVYTQSFTLPIVEGAQLTKAINLNIQMSSPDDLATSYFGSRVLARDDAAMRFEIATAFIQRKIVDDLLPVLFAAGFVATDVESRAISLARSMRIRALAPDPSRAYLLLDIDDTGIDFLVIRKGELYFEYATSWTDIADPKGQVTMEHFSEAVVANLRQVSNFYNQHWHDPLAGIVIIAAAFAKEAEAAIVASAALPIIPPSFSDGPEVRSEWLAAYGAALRDGGKGEISLSGDVASGTYQREQILAFLDFWRVLVPVTLGILVATLVVAYNFLGGMAAQVIANTAGGNQNQLELQISALDASSTAFNQDVQIALAAEADQDKSHTIFDAIQSAAKASSVTLSRVTFQGPSSPITISGVASTASDIQEFKNLLSSNQKFSSVNLPLSGIQPSGSMYSFSMTFSIAGGVYQ